MSGRSRRSSTTPRARPGRSTRSTSSTASWRRRGRHDRRADLAPAAAALGPHHRLRPGRHRPGRRVRLCRHAGLPRAARRGHPDDPAQLQPGHDHDRPGRGRRRLPRAAHGRVRGADHRARATGRHPGRAGRPDGAQPGRRRSPARACSSGRRPAPGHAARGHRDGRGPGALPRPARPHRPALPAVGDRRGRDARGAASGRRRMRWSEIGLPAVIRPAFTLGGIGRRHRRHRDGLPGARAARACAPAPSARSSSSAASSAGRRSSTR